MKKRDLLKALADVDEDDDIYVFEDLESITYSITKILVEYDPDDQTKTCSLVISCDEFN